MLVEFLEEYRRFSIVDTVFMLFKKESQFLELQSKLYDILLSTF